MPPPLRDVFVDDSAGLTAEASELIEGNYYRAVPEAGLTDSSLQGMVRGLRRRYDDRFSEYFSAETLAHFSEEIEGRFSGIGLSVTGVEDGLRVEQRLQGLAGGKGRDRDWRDDRLGRRTLDRRPRLRRRHRA